MTQQDLETLFWRATMVCLGLDPDSTDQSVISKVRISWPLNETGNTNWQRDEDTVFLRISPSRDTYGDLYEPEYEYDSTKDEYKEVIRYHRSHQVVWVCYGPHSADIADMIRIGILRRDPHTMLLKQNVAVEPHIRQSVRMPEQDQSGEWWERSDLTCECYELTERRYDEDYIETVPEITLSPSVSSGGDALLVDSDETLLYDEDPALLTDGTKL